MSIEKTVIDLGNDRPITIETGKIAKQANGAVTLRQGDTMLLVACVASDPGDNPAYFPLQVDYREKYSAGGKFAGGFMKREGRPSEKEILTMRMTDRPLRPLFPKGFMDETQCYGLLLSYDDENEADVLNIFGASVALLISDIPFNTPCAAIRVGRIDGEFVANPTKSQMKESDLDLIYSGIPGKVIMIEGDCDELTEEELKDSLIFADGIVTKITEQLKEFKARAGKEDKESILFVVPDQLQNAVDEFCDDDDKLKEVCSIPGKKARNDAMDELSANLKNSLSDDLLEIIDNSPYFGMAFDDVVERTVRSMILDEGKRMDGRAMDELRELSAETNVIPRTHGSALFSRGETQVLSIATLGSGGDAQTVETPTIERYEKDFYLDYNFPNYSVGETGRIGPPKRREIGHGHLAERSVAKMIPEDSPYVMRVISEIMESNGSTSMASICAASLSLMDAGVKMKKAVAGISCGMISEGEKMVFITDILGSEDHFGDMDFKVAGTRDGITGFQLDLKIAGLSIDMMYEAMMRDKTARMQILDVMEACLSTPRSEVGEYAPQIKVVEIPQDKIGFLIGPGGKFIKGLCEDTNSQVNVDDSGLVTIFGEDREGFAKALKTVEEIAEVPEVGKTYNGTVSSIKDFGAFVEILPGQDGLCHISELANHRVNKVEEICKEGDTLLVKIKEINGGKISLTHKDALSEGDEGYVKTYKAEDVEIGSVKRGKVVSVCDFGAFVEVLPGVDGLVHISELASHRVSKVEDICREGDAMTIKVLSIDDKGRLKLSRKAALAEMD